jgi:hypothetical protein
VKTPQTKNSCQDLMPSAGKDRQYTGQGEGPEEDLASFTENGLTPAIVNGTAGDLILFDTALFQCDQSRGATPHSPALRT